MAEKLQYELTFKTRAEVAPVDQLVQRTRDLKAETDRLNSLSTAAKNRATEFGYYDLSKAIEQSATATRKETAAVQASDTQRAQAMQTVRKIREELAVSERMQTRITEATARTTGGYKSLGGAAGMAAFQVQDIAVQLQAGTDASLVFAQQLPQLLMIFGPKGAIAGGVISLGFLAYKFLTATKGSEEAAKAQAAYNEKLKELIDLKADQAASAYVDNLRNVVTQLNIVTDAETKMVAARNQVAASSRAAQGAQDDLLKAYLVYQQTVNGVDTSKQQQALAQRQIEQEAADATADQNAKLTEQEAAYDAILKKIQTLKTESAEWEQAKQDLQTKSSDLGADLRLAKATKSEDAVGLELKIAETNRTIEELKQQLAGVPAEVTQLENQARELGVEIDATRLTTAAAIEKINTDRDAKVGQAELDAAVANNKDATEALGDVVNEFKAEGPRQQAAIDTIKKALEDGAISSQEALEVATALQTLLGTLTNTNQSNRKILGDLVTAMQQVMNDQKAMEQRVQGLLNRPN